MKYLIQFIFIFILTLNISAQNLIQNSGFENFKNSDKYLPEHNVTNEYPIQVDDIIGWNSWRDGVDLNYIRSSQINNKFKDTIVSKLNNPESVYKDNTSLCYFIADVDLGTDGYSQIFTVFYSELKYTLKPKTEYYFEMYFKIEQQSDKQNITTKATDLEVFFIDKPFEMVKNKINTENFGYLPKFKIDSKKNIEEFAEWTKLSGTFISKGTEKYIILGNRTGRGTPKTIIFDDLVLIEKSQLELLNLDKSEIGDTLTFQNILFETNSSKITENSFDMLDFVYEILTKNTTISLEISGHTDNVGNDEFNQQLSENRAKAVCDYLISKGISEERLKSSGFGSSKPISDNSTDVGKAQNRRVEFIISKK